VFAHDWYYRLMYFLYWRSYYMQRQQGTPQMKKQEE